MWLTKIIYFINLYHWVCNKVTYFFILPLLIQSWNIVYSQCMDTDGQRVHWSVRGGRERKCTCVQCLAVSPGRPSSFHIAPMRYKAFRLLYTPVYSKVYKFHFFCLSHCLSTLRVRSVAFFCLSALRVRAIAFFCFSSFFFFCFS